MNRNIFGIFRCVGVLIVLSVYSDASAQVSHGTSSTGATGVRDKNPCGTMMSDQTAQEVFECITWESEHQNEKNLKTLRRVSINCGILAKSIRTIGWAKRPNHEKRGEIDIMYPPPSCETATDVYRMLVAESNSDGGNMPVQERDSVSNKQPSRAERRRINQLALDRALAISDANALKGYPSITSQRSAQDSVDRAGYLDSDVIFSSLVKVLHNMQPNKDLLTDNGYRLFHETKGLIGAIGIEKVVEDASCVFDTTTKATCSFQVKSFKRIDYRSIFGTSRQAIAAAKLAETVEPDAFTNDFTNTLVYRNESWTLERLTSDQMTKLFSGKITRANSAAWSKPCVEFSAIDILLNC